MGWPTRNTLALRSLSSELQVWYFVYQLALSGAVSISFWSPPRGVSTIASGSSYAFTLTSRPDFFILPSHLLPPPSSLPPPPQYYPLPTPSLPPSPPSPNIAQPSSHVLSATPDFLPPTPPPPTMPARNDRIAPLFDSQKPRDLRRYFCDLEFLFSRSSITEDSEKKFHATRFLSIDDQELWELVPEFADTTASFAQFTTAIFRLYPEADPSRRYSIAHLDALVTELSHVASLSRARFLEFYRSFFTISSFLRAHDRLSPHEQSRNFIRAIPSHIWHLTQERLHIKCPNVHPDDPYPLSDLRDAVDFVLIASSTPRSPLPSAASSSPELSTPASADLSLAALLDAINELIHFVSSQQQPSPVASCPDSPPPSPRPATCSYCSDTAHFIARCPLVSADIRAGLCRRNTEGKVVLPSGLFVPSRITGPDLRARISSWHSENSAPVSQSPHAVAVPRSHSTPEPSSHSSHSAPDVVSATPFAPTRSGTAPAFPAQNRLADLESQLAALRSRVSRSSQPQPTPYAVLSQIQPQISALLSSSKSSALPRASLSHSHPVFASAPASMCRTDPESSIIPPLHRTTVPPRDLQSQLVSESSSFHVQSFQPAEVS
ncbi:hypothetical protein B0H19DRAFT_593250 [Mycena capillaripes]|nr:hypothetical protein B0H19DRAFT_704795 [Mycena capillaripes]KAJ6525218.1 hypothetical protein B0H19DRAFT_593250 [Mycena capillaripes]